MIQVGSHVNIPPNELIDPITARFPWIKVKSGEAHLDPAEAYDSRRNQYHSTRILVMLERHMQALQVDRILGVTSLDLFIPGMNFIFGEARLPGRVGIISTYRLKTSHHEESKMLQNRSVKEAVHEIGHMMGLNHCPNQLCVMHFSQRLEHTDHKSPDFCDSCTSRVRIKFE